MTFTNSPLVDYTQISPNKDKNRKYPISRISIHCVVGQCSVETLGRIFAPTSKEASSNYGIGYDGRVGMYVEEKDRSWCTSSSDNDNRAVTIECASDTYAPYKVYDAVYNKLIELVTDICKRNGKTKVIWFGDKEKTLSYKPADNEMVLTVHRWFANKSCPGDYLFNLHPQIAEEVNERLASVQDEDVCYVPARIVRLGDENGYVRTMQILLNKYNNAKLVEDGIFGSGTLKAVKAYQKSRKLEIDGVCGQMTWAQLLK